MPPTLRLITGAVIVLVGVVFVVVAVLGARSALRRNRWVGVRTPATLASEPAFTIANRAAAAPSAGAGAVAVLGGAVLLAGADGVVGWVVLVISVLGAAGLAGVAGLVGDRVATSLVAAVVRPEPFAAACAGTCAGCDLVAGCRPHPTAPVVGE